MKKKNIEKLTDNKIENLSYIKGGAQLPDEKATFAGPASLVDEGIKITAAYRCGCSCVCNCTNGIGNGTGTGAGANSKGQMVAALINIGLKIL